MTRLTVRRLVGFGRFPYSKGRLTKADELIISKHIDFLHLTELEGRYLDELSGGQRQRAYVAMVLCQRLVDVGAPVYSIHIHLYGIG